MRKILPVLFTLMVCIFLITAGDTHATKLEVGAESSAWAHLFADAILYLHIGGGAVGILAGITASVTRKGGMFHRTAGKIFFVSMFIAYFIGAAVAPFLADGQRPNFIAAVLALYLLITGVSAARRRDFKAGLAEKIGLAIALIITGMGVLFMYVGSTSESGTVDGSPPQAFILFIVVGSIAAADELNAILRGTLANTARVARHLWRMCISFFIASASLFLGQPQVFPTWFSETIFPVIFAITPIVVALIWTIKIRIEHFLKTKKLAYAEN
jgi:hypothetical protein